MLRSTDVQLTTPHRLAIVYKMFVHFHKELFLFYAGYTVTNVICAVSSRLWGGYTVPNVICAVSSRLWGGTQCPMSSVLCHLDYGGGYTVPNVICAVSSRLWGGTQCPMSSVLCHLDYGGGGYTVPNVMCCVIYTMGGIHSAQCHLCCVI